MPAVGQRDIQFLIRVSRTCDFLDHPGYLKDTFFWTVLSSQMLTSNDGNDAGGEWRGLLVDL